MSVPAWSHQRIQLQSRHGMGVVPSPNFAMREREREGGEKGRERGRIMRPLSYTMLLVVRG